MDPTLLLSHAELAEGRPSPSPCPDRIGGFTLVELLVVIAIIGLLVAMLLPAVQTAREAARRIQCSNRVRQLAIAIHNYHSVVGHFPPGVSSVIESSASSNCTISSVGTGTAHNMVGRAPWTVAILPQLEEQARFDRFDMKQPFFGHYPGTGTAGPPNDVEQLRPLAIFKCSSNASFNDTDPANSYYGVQGGGPAASPDNDGCSSLAGQRVYFYNGIFYNNSKVRVVPDGTSNTFMLGETKYHQLKVSHPQWYESWASSLFGGSGSPDSGTLYTNLAAALVGINALDCDPETTNCHQHVTRGFGSYHPGGCHFAMADGAVRFVSEDIDLFVYQSTGSCNDGFPLGDTGF